MKKVFFTLIALQLSIIAVAQEAIIQNMTRGFQGVFTAQDGNLYYTYHIKDKENSKDKAVLEVYSFNQELMPKDTSSIEISKSATVLSSALNMDTYLFILADQSKKSITTLAYHIKNGIIKNTSQQNLSSAYFDIDHFISVSPAMPEGFLIVSEEHGKKNGYKIEALDREMNIKWSKSYMPEKGDWSIVRSYPNMERLSVLRKEQNGNKYSYTMQGIQGDMGDEMFSSDLNDSEDDVVITGINTHMELTSLAGLYYKNGKTDKKPEGIFFRLLGPAGDPMKNVKIPMSEISEKVGGHTGANIATGAYKMYPLDISRSPGGYLGVAELYTGESISGNEKSYTVMDFVLFHMNDVPADVIDTNIRIESREKGYRQAIIKGDVSDKSDLEIAGWLYRNNFFSYRSIYLEAQPRVLYRGDDTVGSRLYSLMLGDTVKKESPAELIHRGELKKNAKEDGKYYFDVSKPMEMNRFLYRDIIPKRENQALYYEYESPKLTIWKSHIL